VEMYARGLSTRDIEELLADETGQSLLSRTAVSEITERLWAEYEAAAAELQRQPRVPPGRATHYLTTSPSVLRGTWCSATATTVPDYSGSMPRENRYRWRTNPSLDPPRGRPMW
jgi:hypothetical protein